MRKKSVKKRMFELTLWIGDWRCHLKIPLGWVLLTVLAFVLLLGAGPLATTLWGGDAQDNAIQEFRASAAYADHMRGLEGAKKAAERKRERDARRKPSAPTKVRVSE